MDVLKGELESHSEGKVEGRGARRRGMRNKRRNGTKEERAVLLLVSRVLTLRRSFFSALECNIQDSTEEREERGM